jgi:AbrB family looped-hinge helix DNA binding protein
VTEVTGIADDGDSVVGTPGGFMPVDLTPDTIEPGTQVALILTTTHMCDAQGTVPLSSITIRLGSSDPLTLPLKHYGDLTWEPIESRKPRVTIGLSESMIIGMSRTTLRARGQITLPEDIRSAARLEEGDLLDAEITEDGILLRPRKIIDATQAWFWTPPWQAGEREADADLAAGRVERFDSGEALVAGLRSIAKPIKRRPKR